MLPRLDELGIDKLLARAQSILKDMELVAASVGVTNIGRRAVGISNVHKLRGNLKCFTCSSPNHFSRDYQSQSNMGSINDQG